MGMATQTLEVRTVIDASPAVVWSYLADSSTWPDWTTIDAYQPERPAGPDGTGEVRLFSTGRYRLREEIVEKRSEQRLSYTVLNGLAVRDYRADVDLVDLGDGTTQVTWHTEFAPKVPGTGWLYRRSLTTYTRKFVAGLEARCVSARQASGQ